MDRIAVISDAHADAHALDSVFAAIDAAGIERVWCLGDFCSGGPQPAECFDQVTELCERVLLGNHEVFVLLRVWRQVSEGWALSAQMASEELGPERLEALAEMRSHALNPHAELVHGALSDPTNDFLLDAEDAALNLRALNRPLLCFGHTHQAALWLPGAQAGTAVFQRPAVGYECPLPAGERRLLNPGAVCDDRGARWLELRLTEGGDGVAVWHQTDVPGHGGIFSITPDA